MITKQMLEEAPAFTVFRGPAEDPKLDPGVWDLFSVSGHSELPTRVVRYLLDMGIQLAGAEGFWVHPEVDDEHNAASGSKFDDFDAALAYLNEGGTLCKVPDTLGSKYSRLYAVARVKGARAGKALPEKPCVYCGEPWEGFYTVHEDSSMSGPEVPLCNRCGGGVSPTAGEIWRQIAGSKGLPVPECICDADPIHPVQPPCPVHDKRR